MRRERFDEPDTLLISKFEDTERQADGQTDRQTDRQTDYCYSL